MGYYTKHRIRIINEYNTEENLIKLKELIEKISGYTFHISGEVITDYDGYKWYECENNMEAVSRFLPEFEIQVRGKGEEGEIWEKVFQDGSYYSETPYIFSEDESDSDCGAYSDSEEEIYIEINKQKYLNY